MQKLNLTPEGLVEYAWKCKEIPHIYCWDSTGQYLTNELLDSLSTAYPDWYIPERLEPRRALAGQGIRCWDCIGLIKAYVWGDYHQGNEGYYSKETDICTRIIGERLAGGTIYGGTILTLPERPGIVLFTQGHVGVYIGNRRAIEFTSNQDAIRPVRERRANEPYYGPENRLLQYGGIVETLIDERPWTHWVQFPGIKY